MTLVERLRLEPDETTKQQVSGDSLLHGCVLVGRTQDGRLGFVSHLYRVQAGVVQSEAEAYFEAPRKIWATSGCSMREFAAIQSWFSQNVATWIDPPERVAARFFETVKRSTPMSGGPNQVVRLDARGARWISRPPQAALPLVGNLTAATITAAVSMTSPSLTISGPGGAWTINLDVTNGFKMTRGSGSIQIGASATILALMDTNFVTTLLPGGLAFTQVAPAAVGAIGPTGVGVTVSGVTTAFQQNGFSLYGGNVPYTGNVQAAYAANRSVLNGVII